MTEEAKKKRDELAEEYCARPLPEALKKDLIKYKPDNLKIIQRMEYAAYKQGFDVGYQVAMGEANERIQKLREALEFYADRKKWSKEWDEFDRGFSRWCILYSDVEEINDSVGYCGKTARAALKEDDSKST